MALMIKQPTVSVVERSASESSIATPAGSNTAENLTSVPSCFLPCLDPVPGSNASVQTSEVPFKDFSRLDGFSREHDVESLVVIRTAWALVLRSYLGVESVSFGLCEPRRDGSGNDESAKKPMMGVEVVELHGAETIYAILKAMMASNPRARLASGGTKLASSAKPFNTAVEHLKSEPQGLVGTTDLDRQGFNHDLEDVRS